MEEDAFKIVSKIWKADVDPSLKEDIFKFLQGNIRKLQEAAITDLLIKQRDLLLDFLFKTLEGEIELLLKVIGQEDPAFTELCGVLLERFHSRFQELKPWITSEYQEHHAQLRSLRLSVPNIPDRVAMLQHLEELYHAGDLTKEEYEGYKRQLGSERSDGNRKGGMPL